MSKYGHGNTEWFIQDRFGMFIHWGLYSLAARSEWLRHRELMSEERYRIYFELFNPKQFDPVQWARATKQAGMKYAVVTAKHHDGFCLWDSAETDWKITKTPFGRDALREILDAFRAEGLKVGVYYSLIDWHHPDFLIDTCIGPDRNLPEEERLRLNSGRDMRRYAEYMRRQVREQLTGYGKLDVLWFDFSYPAPDRDPQKGKGRSDWESEELVRLVRRLQPEIILNNRLDLPDAGDVVTPEQYTPDTGMVDESGNPAVWEGCQTLSGAWCYNRDEKTWKTPEQCIQMLIEHVSRGGNLLLNIGPCGRGFIDGRARERLRDIGEWMSFNGDSIYGCGAVPDAIRYPPPANTAYTYNPSTGRLYVHLFTVPLHHLTLKRLGGKIRYAQVLADNSEIMFTVNRETRINTAVTDNCGLAGIEADSVTLWFPSGHFSPITRIPVLEIILNEPLGRSAGETV